MWTTIGSGEIATLLQNQLNYPPIWSGSSLGRQGDEPEQSLGAAWGVARGDDHDRQPAVLVDALREADSGRNRMEAVRDLPGVHVVHPLSDMGPTTRRLVDRSSGAASLRHGCGRAVRCR